MPTESFPRYVEPLFRPPSEARSLIFQITVGCSQNTCTFCGMYKRKKFRIRPVGEMLDEISGIPERYRPNINRVFLADGDALIYPYDGLVTLLDALASVFPNLTKGWLVCLTQQPADKNTGAACPVTAKTIMYPLLWT
jgi:radical SAM superfamily enzyme YgiQ (UPF0313 family)